ncbi:glycosyltransferase, partial [Bacillus subtilis]
SDLFVLPSYSEGMPTVVIEALALKVPVLCTAVGGVPSLFGKHEHLLIKPRSASSITEAVKGYLEVGTWQEVIAEELYQTVLDDYDAFQNAGKLLDVYKDVVKNN